VNLLFVLNKALKGVKRDATVLVPEDSWFTKPTKERSSVRLGGTGYLAMASVIAGSLDQTIESRQKVVLV